MWTGGYLMIAILLILVIIFARLIFPILLRRQIRQQDNFYWKTGPDKGSQLPPSAVDDYDLQRRSGIWL